MSSQEVRALYEDQLANARTEAATWRQRENGLGYARLITFAVGLGTGWFIFGSHQLEAGWIVPPIALFLALLIIHDRTIQRHDRAQRVVDFFERGLSRLDDTWAGQGNPGEIYKDSSHPYENDLDLFGEGSLFELLCTARTRAGEKVLAKWLLDPAPAAVSRQRQEAIQELADRVPLRRELWLLGGDRGGGAHDTGLLEWAESPQVFKSRALGWVAAGFTGVTLAAGLSWILTDAGMMPLIVAGTLQGAFALALRPRVSQVIQAAQAPAKELTVLSHLLSLIEAEPVNSERLTQLRSQLEIDGAPPSSRIADLRRMLDLLDARKNQFFAPFAALLLWGTHLSLALESWRARCGPGLEGWISAAAEIEALCALAGYAYENPDHTFPEIVDDGPSFEGTGLGHPLLARGQCVRNDLSLGEDRPALMMSGSNMSGKSTMLRTVGCSVILAMAGAPVRATALRLSPLQIAASIQISDSLQQGISHFMAEVQRLGQVVELTAGPWPVIFLLDEVLHGTNSHDRRIGAGALIRGLLERKAIGIVTTHDLALADLEAEESGRIRNVHFQDQIVNGGMMFDYRLRPGVVTHSNALELMRSVGLEV